MCASVGPGLYSMIVYEAVSGASEVSGAWNGAAEVLLSNVAKYKPQTHPITKLPAAESFKDHEFSKLRSGASEVREPQ